MKSKSTSRYLLITFLSLFSLSCLLSFLIKLLAWNLILKNGQRKTTPLINFVYQESLAPMSTGSMLTPNASKQRKCSKALAWQERLIPEVLTDFTENTNTETVTVDDVSKTYDVSKIRRTKDMVEILQDSLTFINTYRQPNETITANDIEYTAINGMLTQLDPHSIILPPKEFNEFKIGTTGKFGGLGMVVGLREGILTVISPIEGTPAARAGMKAGDKIIRN